MTSVSKTKTTKQKSFMQIKQERNIILANIWNRKGSSSKQFEENRKRMKNR